MGYGVVELEMIAKLNPSHLIFFVAVKLFCPQCPTDIS